MEQKTPNYSFETVLGNQFITVDDFLNAPVPLNESVLCLRMIKPYDEVKKGSSLLLPTALFEAKKDNVMRDEFRRRIDTPIAMVVKVSHMSRHVSRIGTGDIVAIRGNAGDLIIYSSVLYCNVYDVDVVALIERASPEVMNHLIRYYDENTKQFVSTDAYNTVLSKLRPSYLTASLPADSLL